MSPPDFGLAGNSHEGGNELGQGEEIKAQSPNWREVLFKWSCFGTYTESKLGIMPKMQT